MLQSFARRPRFSRHAVSVSRRAARPIFYRPLSAASVVYRPISQ